MMPIIIISTIGIIIFSFIIYFLIKDPVAFFDFYYGIMYPNKPNPNIDLKTKVAIFLIIASCFLIYLVYSLVCAVFR
jgi:Trk-type K+ transport system membrane component